MRVFASVRGMLLQGAICALLTVACVRGAEVKYVPVEGPIPASEPDSINGEAASAESAVAGYPRRIESWVEAQIELSRRGFSCGSIDGVGGAQTGAALRAFQERNGLPATGKLDNPTLEVLQLSSPAYFERSLAAADLERLQPVSETWLGKSQQSELAYETPLEAMAERYHANPKLLQKLNPGIDWSALKPETRITVPAIEREMRHVKASRVRVRLADRVLQALDPDGQVLAHFPVSIARNVEKRPVGGLKVTVIAPDPNYTFDPAVFPESDEGRELGRKLILPPGPNNPVGVAWIGLDRPGYGIHGTPNPEHVGRTESHGCFRLANWDARLLIDLAWVGMPVEVLP